MSGRKDPLFDFIERDPEDPSLFFVDHEELGGKRRFRIKKRTFQVRMQLEEVKSNILNSPNPTEQGDLLADYAATIFVGLEVSPFTGEGDKSPEKSFEDIEDLELIQAVWSEVWSYWTSFRK